MSHFRLAIARRTPRSAKYALGASFLAFLLISLSGCTASNPNLKAKNGARDGQNPARGIASSFLAARAFDRAKVALRRDDSAGLQRAGLEMRRASDAGFSPRLTGAFVAELANDAGQLGARAAQARGEEMIELFTDSSEKYRAALAFAPETSPEKVLDAPTLNALGYFLADRGTTQADFERAARLTRAAYLSWDISGRRAGFDVVGRAQSPQDSYAWSLFKLGKWEQARRQQEQVWDMLRGMGAADTTGEIPFHLAEIYRALGLKDKARETYRQALVLPIDFRTKAKIEGALRLLDLAQV